MIKKILIGVVLLIAVLVVVVMMQPSIYHVERTTQINAPAEVVWAQISNFNRWKSWNPWQKSDPDQKTVVAGEPGAVGHSSRWEGEKSGKGTMTIGEVSKPTRLAIKLDFAEPMQSQADTTLSIVPQGDNVQVSWSIDGENDFVGKFFSLVMGMEDMIGAAYEEGLADLKTIAEANAKKPQGSSD